MYSPGHVVESSHLLLPGRKRTDILATPVEPKQFRPSAEEHGPSSSKTCSINNINRLTLDSSTTTTNLSSSVPAAWLREQQWSLQPGRAPQGLAHTWTKPGHTGSLWDNSGGRRNNRRPATQRVKEEHIKPSTFSNRCISVQTGTHVGHRAAVVGAVYHLTAGHLIGTHRLIQTGNCADKTRHKFSLVSPSVEDEFLAFWCSLCFPRAPFSRLASG